MKPVPRLNTMEVSKSHILKTTLNERLFRNYRVSLLERMNL